MTANLTTDLWNFIAEREGDSYGQVGYSADDMMEYANEYVEERLSCDDDDYKRVYRAARIVVEHDDEMLVTNVRFAWVSA